jgi:hypothetical protein
MSAFVGEISIPALAGQWLPVLQERIASADEEAHSEPEGFS